MLNFSFNEEADYIKVILIFNSSAGDLAQFTLQCPALKVTPSCWLMTLSPQKKSFLPEECLLASKKDQMFPLSRDFPSAEQKQGVRAAENRPRPNDEGYMGANIIAKASLFSYAGDFQCTALLGEMTFRCVWNTLPSLATDNALQRCDMYNNGSKSSLDFFSSAVKTLQGRC